MPKVREIPLTPERLQAREDEHMKQLQYGKWFAPKKVADARSCTRVWQTDGPKRRNISSAVARLSISKARHHSGGLTSCGATLTPTDDRQ